jgi:hypothetical protein
MARRARVVAYSLYKGLGSDRDFANVTGSASSVIW